MAGLPTAAARPGPTPGYELSVVDLDRLRSAVCAAGELDLAAREELAEVLRRHDGERCRVVRVDLSQVTFLDCSCLGVLVASHVRLLDSDGVLVLTGIGEAIARLLRIVRLADTLFTLPADQDPFDDVLPGRGAQRLGVPSQRTPAPADEGAASDLVLAIRARRMIAPPSLISKVY